MFLDEIHEINWLIIRFDITFEWVIVYRINFCYNFTLDLLLNAVFHLLCRRIIYWSVIFFRCILVLLRLLTIVYEFMLEGLFLGRVSFLFDFRDVLNAYGNIPFIAFSD